MLKLNNNNFNWLESTKLIDNYYRAANVLITNTRICKLADFGISSQAEQHTEGGLFEGSPYWIVSSNTHI